MNQMNFKQQITRRTVKWIDINPNETIKYSVATTAMEVLLRNGYAVMHGYAINEIVNLIRSLKEMKIEYQLKVIQDWITFSNNKEKAFEYYFTLPFFKNE